MRWDDAAIALLKARYPSEGPARLAAEFGVTPSAVMSQAHRHRLKSAHKALAGRRFSDEEETAIADAYAVGASSCQLAKQYQTCEPTVLDAVRRQGRKARALNEAHHPSEFRRDFFDAIDSEAKAYWLGFILADGCVVDQYRLNITAATADGTHLELLRRELRASVSVKTYSYQLNGHWPNGKPRRHLSTMAHLTIGSKDIVAALVRLGITPRKSLTVKPPEVRPDLQRHFWRGVVDGDGWISVGVRRDREEWRVGMSGTEAVCRGFASFVSGSTLSNHAAKEKQILSRCEGTHFVVSFSGLPLPRQIASLLYGGATVSLSRKQALADRLIATCTARK